MLTICLFLYIIFNTLYSITVDVNVSTDKVKVFNHFEYSVVVNWTETEGIEKIVIEKINFDDFTVFNFKDERTRSIEENETQFKKKRIFYLKPNKLGGFTLPPIKINTYKNNGTKVEQIIEKKDLFIEVVNALNVQKILKQVVLYLLVIGLLFFLVFIFIFIWKEKSKKRQRRLEIEMKNEYFKNIMKRFSNDYRKKAFVLNSFILFYKEKSLKEKTNILNKNFWDYIDNNKINKMGDFELDKYNIYIENAIINIRE